MVQDEAAPATTCKQRLGYRGCRSGGSCPELELGQLSRGAKEVTCMAVSGPLRAVCVTFNVLYSHQSFTTSLLQEVLSAAFIDDT